MGDPEIFEPPLLGGCILPELCANLHTCGCACKIYFVLYFGKIEPPRTQGKEHKNSTDTELKVTTTQCCLRLLFHFLNGFPQVLKQSCLFFSAEIASDFQNIKSLSEGTSF